jgi:hypothetical protein
VRLRVDAAVVTSGIVRPVPCVRLDVDAAIITNGIVVVSPVARFSLAVPTLMVTNFGLRASASVVRGYDGGIAAVVTRFCFAGECLGANTEAGEREGGNHDQQSMLAHCDSPLSSGIR